MLADPIVAQANQELAAAQAQPVPTEDEALQAEQHTAWAAYDFERCIVIFSRLLEMHPDDAGYKEKLVTSYFNRGKQYEAQGDERRASQLYYSALSLDPGFSPAQEAAEAFLQIGGRRGRRRLVAWRRLARGRQRPRAGRDGGGRLRPAARPSPGGGRSR